MLYLPAAYLSGKTHTFINRNQVISFVEMVGFSLAFLKFRQVLIWPGRAAVLQALVWNQKQFASKTRKPSRPKRQFSFVLILCLPVLTATLPLFPLVECVFKSPSSPSTASSVAQSSVCPTLYSWLWILPWSWKSYLLPELHVCVKEYIGLWVGLLLQGWSPANLIQQI